MEARTWIHHSAPTQASGSTCRMYVFSRCLIAASHAVIGTVPSLILSCVSTIVHLQKGRSELHQSMTRLPRHTREVQKLGLLDTA